MNEKKIRKYLYGSFIYQPLLHVKSTWDKLFPTYLDLLSSSATFSLAPPSTSASKSSFNTGVAAAGQTLMNMGISKATNLFEDSGEVGQVMGNLFSTGVSSANNTMFNNVLAGNSIFQGVGKNSGAALAGAGAGIAANYIGRGVTTAMGDSRLGRGIGAGLSTGLGTVGGAALLGAITGVKEGSKVLTGAAGAGKAISNINPYGLAGQVVGSALSAVTGPSKEYQGKYGGITRGMDTAYDIVLAGIGSVPGWGQIAAGAMALNKGLSNIFGSTDAMTKLDAILGSAFMPAPVKWLNMAGAKTTGNFNNQSWQNTLKTDSFMGSSFGNLSEKFATARNEAGKTYGTFSRRALRKALKNIDYANRTWNTILDMADQAEYLDIRSLAMSSINNQRYALAIQGGFNPLARGKQGMKILNNSINHNLGLRFLSGAALIDNKQIILSRCKEID